MGWLTVRTGATHLYSQHKLLITEDNQIALQLQVGSSCSPLRSHQRGPGWWKGKLIYFGCQQLGWGVDTCPKADTRPLAPPPLTISGQDLFQTEGRRRLHAEAAVNSDDHLETRHRWSDRRPLDGFWSG